MQSEVHQIVEKVKTIINDRQRLYVENKALQQQIEELKVAFDNQTKNIENNIKHGILEGEDHSSEEDSIQKTKSVSVKNQQDDSNSLELFQQIDTAIEQVNQCIDIISTKS